MQMNSANVNVIEDKLYMGESYQERLEKITDKNAANAFQVAYAKRWQEAWILFQLSVRHTVQAKRVPQTL